MTDPNDKKILLVGPGALGTYFAARLGRRYRHLWVLDHRESRAAQLQERGFHTTGASLLGWVPPDARVAASVRGWPEMDLVLFLVKGPSLKEAVRAAGPVCGKKTVRVILQNGWGAEAGLKEKPSAFTFGITDEAVTQETAGRVFHAAAGVTVLDAAGRGAKDAAAALRHAGFEVELAKDFDRRRWAKLVVNAAVNPLGALADVPNGRLAEPPLRGLLDRVIGECVALSAADGRKLPLPETAKRVAAVIEQTKANRNSLWQDLVRKRPTEREYILGPFLEIARRKRAPAPLLSSLDRLIRRVEAFSRA